MVEYWLLISERVRRVSTFFFSAPRTVHYSVPWIHTPTTTRGLTTTSYRVSSSSSSSSTRPDVIKSSRRSRLDVNAGRFLTVLFRERNTFGRAILDFVVHATVTVTATSPARQIGDFATRKLTGDGTRDREKENQSLGFSRVAFVRRVRKNWQQPAVVFYEHQI